METLQATNYLLKSKIARTDNGGYALDLEREGNNLMVTTWGYDCEGIAIPQTRPELISLKNRLQLQKMNGPLDSVSQIALRYYLDILKRDAAELTRAQFLAAGESSLEQEAEWEDSAIDWDEYWS